MKRYNFWGDDDWSLWKPGRTCSSFFWEGEARRRGLWKTIHRWMSKAQTKTKKHREDNNGELDWSCWHWIIYYYNKEGKKETHDGRTTGNDQRVIMFFVLIHFDSLSDRQTPPTNPLHEYNQTPAPRSNKKTPTQHQCKISSICNNNNVKQSVWCVCGNFCAVGEYDLLARYWGKCADDVMMMILPMCANQWRIVIIDEKESIKYYHISHIAEEHSRVCISSIL